MDLGIDKLSDDQLLDLLKEATAVLGTRDPTIRRFAQAAVYDEAEKLKLKKEAIVEAVGQVRIDYERLIQSEALEYARELAANGTLQTMTSAEEAAFVVQSQHAAKKQILDELSKPNGADLTFHISADQVSIRSGTINYDTRRAGLTAQLREAIRRIVGVS